jgi:hypothetical protein
MSNLDNDPRYANEKEAQARRDLDRRLQQRDDENTSRGLLIGVLATVAIALGALAWFLLLSYPSQYPRRLHHRLWSPLRLM